MKNIRKVFFVAAICAVALTSAVPCHAASDAAEIEKELSVMALPMNEASLPTVVAKQWLHYSDVDATIEGPSFDRDGNFYFVSTYEGKVMKVDAKTKKITVVYEDGKSHFASLDIHKDGRLFLCDLGGRVLAMQPDGTEVTEILTGLRNPDDIIFCRDGSFYLTELVSNYRNSDGKNSGRVLKVSADYKTVTTLFDGYAGANGVALSPDEKYLYTTEFMGNTLIRTDFMPDGSLEFGYGCQPIYRFTGICGPDSTCVDSAGNVLQPIYKQGRVLILDKNGIQFMNVLIEGRAGYMKSSNVCIKPGTTEAYITCAGAEGAGIFVFEAPAEAIEMYSHQK